MQTRAGTGVSIATFTIVIRKYSENQELDSGSDCNVAVANRLTGHIVWKVNILLTFNFINMFASPPKGTYLEPEAKCDEDFCQVEELSVEITFL